MIMMLSLTSITRSWIYDLVVTIRLGFFPAHMYMQCYETAVDIDRIKAAVSLHIRGAFR